MRAKLLKSVCLAVAVAAAAPAGWARAQAGAAEPTVVEVPCDPAALAADIAAAASGQTLRLAPLCEYVLGAALPAIRQDLAIEGDGATLERSFAPGTAPFSILTVTSGELTVSGLTFRNGGTGGGAPQDGVFGGAIHNVGGDVTVRGGAFIGNGARLGGAIDNEYQEGLTVVGAAFIHNRAVYGGAVDNDGAAAVRGDIFRRNSASEWGGALLTDYAATLTGCVFIQNVALVGGGVFSSVASTVIKSDFRGNQAYNGGAIFNDQDMTLSGAQIIKNTATFGGGGLYDDIFGSATLARTAFRGNQAGYGGGAIFNEDDVTLIDSGLSGNIAGRYGGGIYTAWVLAVRRSRIVGNAAALGGGGIHNGDDFGPPGIVTLARAVLLGNRPDNCDGCQPDGPQSELALRPHPAGAPGLRLAGPGVAAALALARRAWRTSVRRPPVALLPGPVTAGRGGRRSPGAWVMRCGFGSWAPGPGGRGADDRAWCR
jgi:predicted outer membrane repeat protein